MPETPEQFFTRVASAGPGRAASLTHGPTWPYDGQLSPRRLQYPLLPEPPRAGERGRPCGVCAADPEPIWADEHFGLRLRRDSGLPFAARLVPHEHLDFGALDDERAARLGLLLVRLDRAVHAVLGVGRVHLARWGDEQAHAQIHVSARPAGQMQLQGPLLTLWDALLPAVPEWITTRNGALVAAELVRSVGGRAAS